MTVHCSCSSWHHKVMSSKLHLYIWYNKLIQLYSFYMNRCTTDDSVHVCDWCKCAAWEAFSWVTDCQHPVPTLEQLTCTSTVRWEFPHLFKPECRKNELQKTVLTACFGFRMCPHSAPFWVNFKMLRITPKDESGFFSLFVFIKWPKYLWLTCLLN